MINTVLRRKLDILCLFPLCIKLVVTSSSFPPSLHAGITIPQLASGHGVINNHLSNLQHNSRTVTLPIMASNSAQMKTNLAAQIPFANNAVTNIDARTPFINNAVTNMAVKTPFVNVAVPFLGSQTSSFTSNVGSVSGFQNMPVSQPLPNSSSSFTGFSNTRAGFMNKVLPTNQPGSQWTNSFQTRQIQNSNFANSGSPTNSEFSSWSSWPTGHTRQSTWNFAKSSNTNSGRHSVSGGLFSNSHGSPIHALGNNVGGVHPPVLHTNHSPIQTLSAGQGTWPNNSISSSVGNNVMLQNNQAGNSRVSFTNNIGQIPMSSAVQSVQNTLSSRVRNGQTGFSNDTWNVRAPVLRRNGLPDVTGNGNTSFSSTRQSGIIIPTLKGANGGFI